MSISSNSNFTCMKKDTCIIMIRDEYTLSKKPMVMDALIMKKKSDSPIKKNIGHLFRRYNIVEYKSPEDYLSVNDFYKVYGYACLYQAVMDLIVRANWDAVKEEKDMCEALRELFAEELKESREEGLKTGEMRGIQMGEIRGIKLAKKIFKLSGEGAGVKEIAVRCGISEKRVREVME